MRFIADVHFLKLVHSLPKGAGFCSLLAVLVTMRVVRQQSFYDVPPSPPFPFRPQVKRNLRIYVMKEEDPMGIFHLPRQ